jgi:hypothetical protein
MRSLMYIFCTAGEDVDVQKRGIVCVVMNMGSKCGGLLFEEPLALKIPLLLMVFPVRVDATHICREKPSSSRSAHFAKLAKLFPSAMGSRLRVRVRYYSGTYNIILESLEVFQERPFLFLACYKYF